MDSYLSKLEYNFWEKSIVLTDGLERLVKCPFLIGKGLVLLDYGGQFIPENEILSDIDKCEYESFENHFHIDDFVAKRMNFNDIIFLGLGLEFLKQLVIRIKNELPENDFRFILSFGKVDDPDVYEFGNCVVRFYQIRSASENVFKREDLNTYLQEGVIEIEIKNKK
ncbi:MAG: hypothetical protein V4548_01480 [Bacteroidota bacterium]